jgi:hypothetical protein
MRHVASSTLALAVAAFVGCLGLTSSAAPINPSLPNPPNLASNVPANTVLTWSPGEGELVINGGFETGNFTGWSKLNITEGGGGGGFGNPNDTYINSGTFIPNDGDGPYRPYAGNFSSVTDQNGPGSIILYQDVAIPANATSVVLTWAHMIRNQFNTFAVAPQPQEYRAEIRRLDNNVLATAYRTEPGDPTRTDWMKQSFSLDAFKGQTIRLAFVEEQFRNFFNLHLDNISIRIRDAGAFTYQIYFGTTSVLTTNHLVGSTTNGSWSLPQLNPQTTYYWRVNAQQGTNQVVGPVWRFTTAPVASVDHFGWDVIPSPQLAGASVPVKLTALDAANNPVTTFAGPVNLSAASVSSSTTGTLLNSPAPESFAAFDRATVGYSFTPSQDLLVTGIRHYSGRKVSVWTDSGALLGSTLVSGTPGSWHETPITPIQLFAGKTYRVGLYSPSYETNYLRLDGTPAFAHGTLLTSYQGQGDAFPTNVHSARWWLLDLTYSAQTLQPIVVTPNTAGVFSNGTWNGTVTLTNAANVLLRAEDANGHIGLSSLVSFINDFDHDGMPDEWESANRLDPEDPTDALDDDDHDGSNNLAEYRAGTDPQSAASALRIISLQRNGSEVRLRISTVSGKTYTLETTSNLPASNWQVVRDNIAGPSEEIVLPNVIGSPNFFRLRLR